MLLRLLLLLTMIAGIGCGSNGLAPVRGRVTMHGKPVTEGRITFYPESGVMAQGSLGADGEYRLTTFNDGDGAALGKHRVVIKATRVTGPASPSSLDEELKLGGGGGTLPEGRGGLEWLTPEEYSERETSPLSAEVVRGANRIDFALPVQ